jgi:hypothetical protein
MKALRRTYHKKWPLHDSQTDTSGIAYYHCILLPSILSLSSLKDVEVTLDGEIEIS